MPDIAVYLYVDERTLVENNTIFDVFDEVFSVNNGEKTSIVKSMCCNSIREERVLFLDGDTYLVEPVYEIFDLLSRFELAACHAPYRHYREQNAVPYKIDVPESFPELNTGVIGFRNNERVRAMLRKWRQLHHTIWTNNNPTRDQPAFRLAVWESDLTLYVMPSEYNFRFIFPAVIGGNARVKILHGRTRAPDELARVINSRTNIRVFNPNSGRLMRLHGPSTLAMAAIRRLKRRVRRDRG